MKRLVARLWSRFAATCSMAPSTVPAFSPNWPGLRRMTSTKRITVSIEMSSRMSRAGVEKSSHGPVVSNTA